MQEKRWIKESKKREEKEILESSEEIGMEEDSRSIRTTLNKRYLNRANAPFTPPTTVEATPISHLTLTSSQASNSEGVTH
jgi:hypothetical protein